LAPGSEYASALCALFVLARLPEARTPGQERCGPARSKKGTQAARSAREPWLLAASTRFANWPAERLVRVCRQRIRIELSFRVMKNEPFGEDLERRAYSRLFLVRLLLTMEQGKAAAEDLADAIGPLHQWIASNHAALLAE
jgi:hypothetical protein